MSILKNPIILAIIVTVIVFAVIYIYNMYNDKESKKTTQTKDGQTKGSKKDRTRNIEYFK